MSSASEKAKLILGVLSLQVCLAGFHVVSRAALNMGVSKIVFPVYRNTIALALLCPFAYFLEKKDRPRLTFSLLVRFFLLALCGITANQGFYILGLYYLSPTYASAIQNAVPAITFAIAVLLRVEQVNIDKKYGVAKVIGTVVSIAGATAITLYKGPPLLHLQPGRGLQETSAVVAAAVANTIMNWTLGCLFIIGNCLAWSGWMVLQVPVLKVYPARLSSLALQLALGLVQFLIIAAFFENDVEQWKIHSGGELFTIGYAGFIASGLGLTLQIWCIDKGGPLFTAVFQPVQTIMVAGLAALVLGDQLYTGGMVGSALIIVGLYFVLWGKSQEKKAQMALQDEQLSSHLLKSEMA